MQLSVVCPKIWGDGEIGHPHEIDQEDPWVGILVFMYHLRVRNLTWLPSWKAGWNWKSKSFAILEVTLQNLFIEIGRQSLWTLGMEFQYIMDTYE